MPETQTILFLASNPSETGIIQLEKEHSRISRELQDSDHPQSFIIRPKDAVTLLDFQESMSREKPTIVHFSGHGVSGKASLRETISEHGRSLKLREDDPEDDSGIILLDYSKRQAFFVPTQVIKRIFESHMNLSGLPPVRIVLFNSCYSQAQAEAIAQIVPYVIGSTSAVNDEAAIAFATGFYSGISEGLPVEMSVDRGITSAMAYGEPEDRFVLYRDGKKVDWNAVAQESREERNLRQPVEERSTPPPTADQHTLGVIPTFIGFTEKAEKDLEPAFFIPTFIRSLEEYHDIFGGEFEMEFELIRHEDNLFVGFSKGTFFLYRSLKLFFANGGKGCYIVSVGPYHTIGVESESFVDLLKQGLDSLLTIRSATLIAMPDLMILPEPADCGAVQQKMLFHCKEETGNRLALLDLFAGFLSRNHEDPAHDLVIGFRELIGMNAMEFGIAYYPWLATTSEEAPEDALARFSNQAVLLDELILENDQLLEQGKIQEDRHAETRAFLEMAFYQVREVTENVDKVRLTRQLKAASPKFAQLLAQIRKGLNAMPPSGAMAALLSNARWIDGRWVPSTHTLLQSVEKPCVSFSAQEEKDLHQPLSLKSINTIVQPSPISPELTIGATTWEQATTAHLNLKAEVVDLTIVASSGNVPT